MRKIGRSRSRMLEQAESANAMPRDNNTDDTQSRAEVKKKNNNRKTSTNIQEANKEI